MIQRSQKDLHKYVQLKVTVLKQILQLSQTVYAGPLSCEYYKKNKKQKKKFSYWRSMSKGKKPAL